MASKIVKIPSDHHSVKVEAIVCNNGRTTRTLPAGQRIGVLEAIESVMIPEYHRNESDNITDETLLRMFDVEELLSTNDNQKFKDLILKNRPVFALTSNDPGCAKDVEDMIQLDDEVPVKERYRRIPPALFDSVCKEIGKMVEAGVIRESHNPYCSPVTIVTPRICIDFRKLIMKIRKDAKNVPRINEILDALNGARVFSSLDLQAGYW